MIPRMEILRQRFGILWCVVSNPHHSDSLENHIVVDCTLATLAALHVVSLFIFLLQAASPKTWRSLDLEPNQRPPFKTQRSSSMPTPKTQKCIDVGCYILGFAWGEFFSSGALNKNNPLSLPIAIRSSRFPPINYNHCFVSFRISVALCVQL